MPRIQAGNLSAATHSGSSLGVAHMVGTAGAVLSLATQDCSYFSQLHSQPLNPQGFFSQKTQSGSNKMTWEGNYSEEGGTAICVLGHF